MKKTALLLTLLVLISTTTFARGELKRGRKVHLFINAAADYHFNGNDIKTDKGETFLSMPNTLNGRVGFELMYIGGRRIFVSTAWYYKMVTHKLNINYNAAKAGFDNSAYTYTDQVKLNVHNIDWNFRGGYSYLINKTSALEVSLGVTFNYPLNGSSVDTLISANINDPYYKEPVAYYVSGLGSITPAKKTASDVGAPFNPVFQLQIAYRIIEPGLFKNRSIKVGLDISHGVGGDALNNTMDATFFGKNRSVAGHSKYEDMHRYIGLFIGVEL